MQNSYTVEAGKTTLEGFNSHYRSGSSDLARDFFIPCLEHCITYKRAVGYFSSSALVTWAKVLPRITKLDTIKIQLLISPLLSEQDKEAIRAAVIPDEREALLQKTADKIVLDALSFAQSPEDIQLRLRLLTWLIASKRLELRFAFPEHVDDPGIFHEKIGIFEFPWGWTVAFIGSANESTMGHTKNYESIDIYRDWLSEDAARVKVKCEQFSEAWSNQAQGLRIRGLSPEALRYIQERAPDEDFPKPPPRVREGSVNRWCHQDEAIDIFLKEERGVLEMATGTGKTRTALQIFEKLVQLHQIESLIVATDGTDLLNQWYEQLLPVSRKLDRPYSIVRHYSIHHESLRYQLDPHQKILLSSRQALAPALRSLQIAEQTLLIHDEVHALGSTKNREDLCGLSDSIRFRLGLSATPEREYDQEGTDFIETHIGPVIFRFEIADAIRREILAPFSYYPLTYQPSEEDRRKLQGIRRRFEARKDSDNPMSQEELWIALARVHKTSKAKLPIFRTFIDQRPDLLTRCIIFVETKEYGEKVLETVHQYRHDFHTYYGEDDAATLARFARGDLECLITCHRLSEGIDIQNLTTVILFSSARTRLETIQRMGRCLRVDPSNPQKRANIIDFVRAPDPQHPDNPDQQRKTWLQELSEVSP